MNVGVTSGGDVFGGTQVTFSDVLGDKQFNLFAASISQYRTLSLVVRRTCRGGSSTRCRATRRRSSSTASSAASSTTRRSRRSSAATRRSRRSTVARRHARSASTRSTATARVELSAGLVQLNEQYNDPTAAAATREQYQQQQLRPAAVPQRHADAARRRLRAGDDGLPRVRAAGRQHDARWRTTSRRRSAACCRGRRSTSTPATTCASATHRRARDARRAASRARATSRTSSTSAATRRCAATTTCSSSARRRVRQRRAALPADRGGAHAARRHRRHPRRVLRQHRRRLVQQSAGYKFAATTTETFSARSSTISGDVDRSDRSQPTSSTPTTSDAGLRRTRRPSPGSGCRTAAPRTASASRPSRSASRSTSTGRGGRCSTRTGKIVVFAADGGSADVPQAALRGLDWIRLLDCCTAAPARRRTT